MKLETIKKKISKYRHRDSPNSQGWLYNQLPFKEFHNIPSYRNNQERINFIKKNIPKGINSWMDLGCSEGSILFHIRKQVEEAVGLDYDKEAIKIAKLIKEYKNIHNLYFYSETIDINTIHHGVNPKYLGFIFLSTFQWIVKQKGLTYARQILIKMSETARYLFFETAGSDSKAPLPEADSLRWQLDLLKSTGWIPEKWKKFDCDTGEKRWIIYALSMK